MKAVSRITSPINQMMIKEKLQEWITEETGTLPETNSLKNKASWVSKTNVQSKTKEINIDKEPDNKFEGQETSHKEIESTFDGTDPNIKNINRKWTSNTWMEYTEPTTTRWCSSNMVLLPEATILYQWECKCRCRCSRLCIRCHIQVRVALILKIACKIIKITRIRVIRVPTVDQEIISSMGTVRMGRKNDIFKLRLVDISLITFN